MNFNYKLLGGLIEHKFGTNKKFAEALENFGLQKTEDAIKKWRQGNSVPKVNELPSIASVLSIKISTLFNEEEVKNDKLVSIPVLDGLAGCGSAGLLEQLRLTDDNMVIDKRIFPADIISKNLAMIRIVGDSMQPYLDENDWAVVQMRNGADVVLTGAVYLLARGDDVQIKRCTFKPDGTCVIISDNQLYPIEEAIYGEWEVLGKVVARLKVGSPFLIKE